MLSIRDSAPSLRTLRHLAAANRRADVAMEHLSSGYRINRAADDAAGLAVSEGLRAQIGGTAQALRNTQDGISVVETADGGLGETEAILHRMRDLAVQAANTGTVDRAARAGVQKEFSALKQEIDRISRTTRFNRTPLLDGSYDHFFQVGAGSTDRVRVVIGLNGGGIDTAGLGLSSVDLDSSTGAGATVTITPAVSAAQGSPSPGRMTIAGDFISAGSYAANYRALTGTVTYNGRSFDFGSVDYTGAVTAQDYLNRLDAVALPALGSGVIPFSAAATGLLFGGDTPGPTSTAADAVALTPGYSAGSGGAEAAITAIDRAVDDVSSLRAYLGAVSNRFAHTISRLRSAMEDTTASESRIRDADIAAETAGLSRAQILSQAGTAMLAQGNQSAQALLKLLG